MTTDEYEAIPEAEWKVLATTEITHLTDEEKDYLPRAWDEWIARVRRDAWDEGFQDGRRYDGEGDDGPRYINPYSGQDAAMSTDEQRRALEG